MRPSATVAFEFFYFIPMMNEYAFFLRDIHFKEKEYLVQDIKRLSIRRDTNTIFETRVSN